jgi:hypothetical protein
LNSTSDLITLFENDLNSVGTFVYDGYLVHKELNW